MNSKWNKAPVQWPHGSVKVVSLVSEKHLICGVKALSAQEDTSPPLTLRHSACLNSSWMKGTSIRMISSTVWSLAPVQSADSCYVTPCTGLCYVTPCTGLCSMWSSSSRSRWPVVRWEPSALNICLSCFVSRINVCLFLLNFTLFGHWLFEIFHNTHDPWQPMGVRFSHMTND